MNNSDVEIINTVVKKRCEDSLLAFVVHFWGVLEPNNPLQANWHIKIICEYLEDVLVGRTPRLIVNIPPRFLKTLLASVFFPAWSWIAKTGSPSFRWIITSYSFDLVTSAISQKIRTIIESEDYQMFWGDKIQLSDSQNTKHHFANTASGFCFATSTGGTVTGIGADGIIVDDPISVAQASQDVEIEKANQFFSSTLMTRFNDPNPDKSRVLVIMQRLHQNDLTGYLLKRGGYELLKVPIEGVEDEVKYTYPKSRKEIVLKRGESSFKQRWSKKAIDAKKQDVMDFSGQYLQEPIPSDGLFLKRDWFKFYATTPEHFERVVISWDMAFKNLDTSDYVVGQVWGKAGVHHYLIDQIRGKFSFPETLDEVILLSKAYPDYDEIIIEEKANGPGIISSLQDRVARVIGYNPTDSKHARLQTVMTTIKGGHVWLPFQNIKPFVDEFVTECCGFPKAPHDDQLDAMVQYLMNYKLHETHVKNSLFPELFTEEGLKAVMYDGSW